MGLMRFGIVCFVILFLGTELYHWLMGLGQFELSLPLTIMAGGGLAIASNLPRTTSPTQPEPIAPETPAIEPVQPSQRDSQPTDNDTISFKITSPFKSK